jgi:SGNH domain-containing protein
MSVRGVARETVCTRGLAWSALFAVMTLVAVCGPASAAGATASPSGASAIASTAQVLRAVVSAPGIATVPPRIDPPLQDAAADHALTVLNENNCDPAFAVATVGKCAFGDLEGKRTIVLLGDSHAGMWFPAFDAIATAAHWKLVVLMKAVCPAVDLSFWYWPTNSPYPSCTAWHQYATQRVNELDPAVVVLTSWWHGVGIVPNGDAPTDAQWELGLEQALISITSPGTKKVVLGDIPYLTQSGPECLAAHEADVQACTTPASDAVLTSHEQALQAAATATGASYIPVTQWMCTSQCTAVIGKYDVYADASEITNQYVDYLQGAIAEALRPVMPSPSMEKESHHRVS